MLVAGGVGSLALVGIAAVAIANATLRESAKSTLQLFRDAHIPTTVAELYPKPQGPDELNAFMLMGRLETACGPVSKWPSAAAKTGAPDIEAVRAHVAANREALVLAELAASRPEWHGIRSGNLPDVKYPEFATVKTATKLLAERSLVRTADGDVLGATKDVATAMKLASLIDREPILIGGLVSIACHNIALRALASVVGPARKDKAAMAGLVKLAEEPAKHDFSNTFLGEAAFCAYLATHKLADAYGDNDPLNAFGDDSAPKVVSRIRGAKMELDRPYWGAVLARRWVGYIKASRANPYDIDANAVAFAKLSEPGDARDGRLAIFQYILPMFDQVFDAYRAEKAADDVTAIGVRAVAAGKAPDVSGTRDPFGDGGYRVVQDGSSFKVYSLGRDRRDDHGRVENGSTSEARRDIVFSWDGEKAKLDGR